MIKGRNHQFVLNINKMTQLEPTVCTGERKSGRDAVGRGGSKREVLKDSHQR